jgi:hypothetical protein
VKTSRLLWFVWSVLFIWLNQTNRKITNKEDSLVEQPTGYAGSDLCSSLTLEDRKRDWWSLFRHIYHCLLY